MQSFEYTVIPAPTRGEKAKGARTGAERFSYALLTEMNRMAANGWEYIRAETLPCEERSGLTSKATVYHNVLVFRRPLHIDRHADRPGSRPVEYVNEPAASTPHDLRAQSPAVRAQAQAPDVRQPARMVPVAPVNVQPDPPPSWPDGPSGDATPTGQPVPGRVPDRTHVPERHVPERASDPMTESDDDLLRDDPDTDGPDTDDRHDTQPRRPLFGEAMPRPSDDTDPPVGPNRLGPAKR